MSGAEGDDLCVGIAQKIEVLMNEFVFLHLTAFLVTFYRELFEARIGT